MASSDPSPPIWFLLLAVAIIVPSQYSFSVLYPAGQFVDYAGRNATFVTVTDSDHASRDGDVWSSFAQIGTIIRDEVGKFSLEFDTDLRQFTTNAAVKGRSMELSAIEYYKDRLLAFCDRSGFIFELDLFNSKSSVLSMIKTGSGEKSAPFKSEWVTIKDDQLYLGSSGKEWVEDGEVIHKDLLWVKVLEGGEWSHEDWSERFDKLRAALGASFPGYLIHESGAWDSRHKQWLFLPRKVSTDTPYDEDKDELLSGNQLLIVSEDFSSISSVEIGPLEREWGFTAIKALPRSIQSPRNSDATILMGIKAKEVAGVVQSKLTVFDTDGNILLDTDDESLFTSLGDLKYEALSFVPDSLLEEPKAKELEMGFLQKLKAKAKKLLHLN